MIILMTCFYDIHYEAQQKRLKDPVAVMRAIEKQLSEISPLSCIIIPRGEHVTNYNVKG
jgi:hypothetical protein